MKRIIGDKLNFLMLLTETKNNILGKAISFDPSYTSRIRTGARGVPKHRDFIYPAAAFFAQAVQTKEQKEKLAEVICPGSGWPKDVNSAISLIANWLKQDLSIGSSFRNHTDDTPRSNHTESTAASASPDTQTGFYYGNAGKRKCVIQFLTELSALNEPVKLLLHSEEDMLWMYEDPDFFENWSVLMRAILQNGSRIVIVHTVRRTLRELLEAVAKWSPLYATGLIESYYCPRLRDNIFKRTLFIGSGKAAIVGQTTGETGKNRLNMFVHDPRAVNALEKEFFDFLSLCRPLMKVYNASNFTQIAPVLSRYPGSENRTVQFHATPSWLSMPENVARSLSHHDGCELFYGFMDRYRSLLFMQEGKQSVPVTDMFSLPDIAAVKDGKVQVPLADVFGLPSLFYTGEEFRQHLSAALHRFKTSGDYDIILLSPESMDPGSGNLPSQSFSVIVNETAGVILYRSFAPSTLFYTREQDMTISFCEYLERFEKNAEPRKVIMEKLEQYLKELEEALR